LLLSGARNRMAAIHARLIRGKHDVEREWLISQSRNLANLQLALRADELTDSDVSKSYAAWQEGLATTPDFAAVQEQSLYNRAQLATLL
ncbi:hypothetical protein, partial [Janibacter hoylei]|uniref:hypothetical protein n=1 Tax=Janibacter hoylei TaxID=364298 RepID=UPI0024906716